MKGTAAKKAEEVGAEKAAGKTKKRTLKAVGVLGVVAVLVAAGAFLWFDRAGSERPYTAVALQNGDVYFGKLSYFPRLALEDVYTVQVVPDESSPDGTAIRLAPLRSAIWAPNKIFLNYDSILFIGPVGEGSQVMQFIERNQSGQ